MPDPKADHAPEETLPAGRMPPWQIGDLPDAPVFRWSNIKMLVGPGLMMAGANIGGGEWLVGPAVTAQYGALLMWVAGVSIVLQMVYNIEVQRYAIYCGEPINVGFFRTFPGPTFWTFAYLALDFGAIWPYLASNAAVPLAAAYLQRLPGAEDADLVRNLGYGIFLAAMLPLIFGGKIYNSLERVMTAKFIVVLGYLTFIAVVYCSTSTTGEIAFGFLRVGTVPLRSQTVVAGDRFTVREDLDGAPLVFKGTFSLKGEPQYTALVVGTGPGSKTWSVRQGKCGSELFDKTGPAPAAEAARLLPKLAPMLALAKRIHERNGFLLRFREGSLNLEIEGAIVDPRTWRADRIVVDDAGARTAYTSVDSVAEPHRERVRKLVDNLGNEPVNLLSYWSQHGSLPDLNWGAIAALAAIAGAGGLTNAQLSNYARDKGWGMGVHVGAIPSAVGGQMIELSHTGRAFKLTPENRAKWKGWFRHVLRDQMLIWVGGCFIGMALPTILSLEFIRNAPVTGDAVAAMTADGLAERAGWIFWPLTLMCGFLVLAPSQVSTVDGILRRWTDVIWTGVGSLRKLHGNSVKYVYYAIMVGYTFWGLFAMWQAPDPLVLVIAATVFMNLALGFSALHTLWVNCTLLPRELRPGWIQCIGMVLCGVFFLGICGIALREQIPYVKAWLNL